MKTIIRARESRLTNLSAWLALALLVHGCDRRNSNAPTSRAATEAVTQAPHSTEGGSSPAESTPPESEDENETALASAGKSPFNAHVIPVDGNIVVPSNRDAAGMPAGFIAAGDLDYDKQNDLVILVEKAATANAESRRITAISGDDHSVIWSVDAPLRRKADPENKLPEAELVPGGLRPIPDINDDTIPDIFVFSAGVPMGFAAVSGRDGTLIGINPEPKSELVNLVDVREVDGDTHPDFVFATNAIDEKDKLSRLGFAVFSSGSFRRVVSFSRPFGRLALRQTLLFGPFPDLNGDKISEILCYGVVPSTRLNPQDEPQFALVDGQRLKRWVLTRTEEDPTRGPAFIAAPGDIYPDGFVDLVISSPGDTAAGKPSQLGLYVMKRLKYDWVDRGDAFGAKGSDDETGDVTTAGMDVNFGAPVVAIPDQDGDTKPDVATTISDGTKHDERQLVLISSATGQLIRRVSLPDANASIDADRERVQMSAFSRNTTSGLNRIAVSGMINDGAAKRPAIILFDIAVAPASAPAGE